MRRLMRAPIRTLVRTLVSSGAGLRLVNVMHRRLSSAWRQRFFYLCCDRTWRVSGRWTVDVAGRRIILPLTRDFPDAWPVAIGFHGYDPELHELYEILLRGPRPPRVVFDVGAHYGLHTLRFLVHGARVLAFEPNPYCHRWLRSWCAANGVACELEPVAVGERAATVVLAVPEGDTCRASILPGVRAHWRDAIVHTVTARQVALDDIVAERGLVPDLVKIDTEGAELAVLRGGVDLLRTAHPTLVFESWREPEARRALWSMLDKHGYAITAVDGSRPRLLTRADFADARATNFLAEVPPGRVIHSARQ
jgi:FkbM family methyltransferase